MAVVLQLEFGLLFPQAAEEVNADGSDPAHVDARSVKPVAWPGGVIPYDFSKLGNEQSAQAREAMRLWMNTGANIRFIPHTTEAEYVFSPAKPTRAISSANGCGDRRADYLV
jgi:hypothetical protein